MKINTQSVNRANIWISSGLLNIAPFEPQTNQETKDITFNF
jgi:hypothetical protein